MNNIIENKTVLVYIINNNLIDYIYGCGKQIDCNNKKGIQIFIPTDNLEKLLELLKLNKIEG